MHPIYICEVELFQLILPLVVILNRQVSPTYKGLNISTSVDCGPPPAPRNGSLESYTNTTEGSVVFYSYDPGGSREEDDVFVHWEWVESKPCCFKLFCRYV